MEVKYIEKTCNYIAMRYLYNVDEFNYLGTLMNYNGRFSQLQKHAADQGRKTLFSVCTNLKLYAFNVETQCSGFFMSV